MIRVPLYAYYYYSVYSDLPIRSNNNNNNTVIEIIIIIIVLYYSIARVYPIRPHDDERFLRGGRAIQLRVIHAGRPWYKNRGSSLDACTARVIPTSAPRVRVAPWPLYAGIIGHWSGGAHICAKHKLHGARLIRTIIHKYSLTRWNTLRELHSGPLATTPFTHTAPSHPYTLLLLSSYVST